jgi:hypothetical protein
MRLMSDGFDATPWCHIPLPDGRGIGPFRCPRCHHPVADAAHGEHACRCGEAEADCGPAALLRAQLDGVSNQIDRLVADGERWKVEAQRLELERTELLARNAELELEARAAAADVEAARDEMDRIRFFSQEVEREFAPMNCVDVGMLLERVKDDRLRSASLEVALREAIAKARGVCDSCEFVYGVGHVEAPCRHRQ